MSRLVQHRVGALLFLPCVILGFGIIYAEHKTLLMGVAAVAAVALVAIMLRWPDTGALAVIFMIYTNLAVVGMRGGSGAPLESDSRSILLASVSLMLAIPFFYNVVIRREKVILDKVFALMLLFLLALLLASIFARDKGVVAKQVADYCIEGLGMYLMIVNIVRHGPMLRRVIWTMLLAGAFMAGLTVFQEVTQTQNNEYLGMAQRGGVFGTDTMGNLKIVRSRAAGPVGEQNRYAQILLVLVPFAAYQFRRERTRLLRLAALGTGLLIVTGMLLTFSRGAFLALAVLVLLMWWLGYVKRHHMALALLACIVLVPILLPEYVVRITSLSRIPGLFSQDSPPPDNAVEFRFAENVACWNVFLDNPVVGVGPGHFAKYYSTAGVNRFDRITQTRNMRGHNLYLEMAAELGIIGLSTFVSILLYLLFQLWRMRRALTPNRKELAEVATAFLLSIVAYMISGIFLHLAYARYFWLLISLAFVAVRLLREQVVAEAVTRIVAERELAAA